VDVRTIPPASVNLKPLTPVPINRNLSTGLRNVTRAIVNDVWRSKCFAVALPRLHVLPRFATVDGKLIADLARGLRKQPVRQRSQA